MKVLIAASLVASLLAGCLSAVDGDGTETPGPGRDPVPLPPALRLLEDPAGDAAARRPRLVQQTAGLSCERFDERLPETPCWRPVAEAASGVGAAGPPELDVLGVTLQETPSTLVFHVELARVDPTFADLLQEPFSGLEIGVCWDTEDLTCDVDFRGGASLRWPVNPFLIVTRGPDAPDFPFEQVYWNDASCVGSGGCRLGVPVVLSAGTPGTVSFEVPRGIIPGTGDGETIHGLLAYTYYFDRVLLDTLEAETPATPNLRASAHDITSGGGQVIDVSDLAEPHRLQLPMSAPVSTLRGTADRVAEPLVGSPEGDILSIDVSETAESLTFSVTLGEVSEEPFDHDFAFAALIAEGFTFRYLRTVSDAQTRVEAVVCPRDGCDRSLPAPVDTEMTVGAPGWLNLTLPRAALGHPPRGSQWAEVSVIVAAQGGETVRGPEGTEVSHRTWVSFDSHFLPLLRPLAMDSSGAELRGRGVAGTAEDDVNDVPYEYFLTRSASNYDIRSVEASPAAPGVVGLTLSLAGLTSEPVPEGYDAAIYAVAVDRDVGATMTYLLRPRSGAIQSYCAEDTLIFASRPQDPTIALSTPIESLINYVTTDASGRGSSGGSITFLTPSECLGLPADAPVEIRSMAGGTFLLKETPNLEDRVFLLDRSADSDPFTIEPLTIQAAAPTFWQAPFGYENGWDILGAALAISTILATALLLWNRRRQLQRYLNEMAAIESRHDDDPARRAEQLVRLRTRLHRDLVRHRVSDAHYSIILDRLRSRITSARLMSVGERIYDVPTNLALRIERLLDDGRLTAEEHRALMPALARAKMPPETRTLVVERLQKWVDEDATIGAG